MHYIFSIYLANYLEKAVHVAEKLYYKKKTQAHALVTEKKSSGHKRLYRETK